MQIIDNRDVFITESIEKAIIDGTPLYMRVLYRESYENYCNIFRESKRAEGAYVPNACLENWAHIIKADFKRWIREARKAHIFDLDSPQARHDLAKRKKFIEETDDD